jgi:hypothetical protein
MKLFKRGLLVAVLSVAAASSLASAASASVTLDGSPFSGNWSASGDVLTFTAVSGSPCTMNVTGTISGATPGATGGVSFTATSCGGIIDDLTFSGSPTFTVDGSDNVAISGVQAVADLGFLGTCTFAGTLNAAWVDGTPGKISFTGQTLESQTWWCPDAAVTGTVNIDDPAGSMVIS